MKILIISLLLLASCKEHKPVCLQGHDEEGVEVNTYQSGAHTVRPMVYFVCDKYAPGEP